MVLDTLVAPAHLWVPDHVATSGPDAAEFAELVGITLDPEQRLALDAILAEAPGRRWAALEAAIISPRQNVKTFLCQVVTLADLFVFGTEFVVWTAHEFSTAMEAFRDVKERLESFDYLRKRVKKVNEANGEEGVEFLSGQRLRFKARTKTGGRGLTGDRIILDEAFALQPNHMGSLMPTLSAKSIIGNPQIIYASSAGMASSDVLRSLRIAERRSLPPAEFARERLGWWEDPAVVTGFSLERWAECADRDAELDDPVVFGVDVAPNSASASIAFLPTFFFPPWGDALASLCLPPRRGA